MKIIFSRKGVDSGTGGCASAIIDGRPISLPIPTSAPTGTSYGDLIDPMPALATDLSGCRLSPDKPCHLDPDIDRTSLREGRPLGWRGAFGQVSAALSHLRNQGVGIGDIFIFWGLFRDGALTETGWRYVGPRRNAIFGWLQIGEVIDLGTDGSHALARYPWLLRHPHVSPGWSADNALFVGSELLNFRDSKKAGYGVFKRAIPLTAKDAAKASTWEAPRWLDPTAGGVGMTYHRHGRWLGNGQVSVVARGQEFVADAGERRDARDWLMSLFEGNV
jgi:Nucleotide modification associated domain 3